MNSTMITQFESRNSPVPAGYPQQPDLTRLFGKTSGSLPNLSTNDCPHKTCSTSAGSESSLSDRADTLDGCNKKGNLNLIIMFCSLVSQQTVVHPESDGTILLNY